MSWLELSAEQKDWTLAERLLELQEEEPTAVASAGDLISALSKLDPHTHLSVSWKVFDGWRKAIPVRQVICLPGEAECAMFALATLLGRAAVGMSILLCFCGLLRAREALGLRSEDVIVSSKSVVLCLGRTKRGIEERVVLTNEVTVACVKEHLRLYPAAPGEFVMPISYGTMLYWTRKLAMLLGFP